MSAKAKQVNNIRSLALKVLDTLQSPIQNDPGARPGVHRPRRIARVTRVVRLRKLAMKKRPANR